jgi:hypothetical protein
VNWHTDVVRAAWISSLVSFAALACVSGPNGFEPVRFANPDRPADAPSYQNWPVSPDQAMALMESRAYEFRAAVRTQGGTGGAEKIGL